MEVIGQHELYKLMGYGFVALIVLIMFVQFYLARGKKVAKMGNKKYFDKVLLRELSKYTTIDDSLALSTSVTWRNSTNTKFHNYYLGLTNKKLILIKVKSFLGSYTDTTENVVLVNHGYTVINNLSINDDTVTEQRDNIYTTYNVKHITFKAGGKTIDLKLKYQDIFDREIPTNQIAHILEKMCG